MLSTLFWVKPREATSLVKFEVTPARRLIYGARRQNSRLVVLKGRQMKITTGFQYDDLLTCLMYRNWRHGFAAQDDDMTIEMFQNYRSAYDWMERNWRLDDGVAVLFPRAIEDSKHHMIFDNGSSIHAGTAASKGFGRGITLNSFHGADLGFWEERQAQIFLTGIEGSISRDASIVLEGTPNGEGTVFHRYYRAAKREKGTWKALFLQWWLESEYQYPEPLSIEDLEEDELRLLNEEALTPNQLAWRRLKRADMEAGISSGEKNPFLAEYPENDVDCWIFSGETIYKQPELKEMLDKVELGEQVGEWTVWEMPKPEGYYIIAADPAEGLGTGDYSVATVWECSFGMEQVARLRGKWSIRPFAQQLAQLGTFYNHGLVAVERNTYGVGVLDVLMTGMGYTDLYWHFDHSNPSLSGRPGWPTTTITKPRMIHDLGTTITEGGFHTADEFLLEELMAYRQLEGIKTGAPKGGNDDLAITAMIANQVRYRHPSPNKDAEKGIVSQKLGMVI